MEKILSILLWIGCIAMLSFAYEDYLVTEFSFHEEEGIIAGKGVGKNVKNIYGNYNVENEYWLQINGKKIVVRKELYDSVEADEAVRVNRTKYGTMIESQ
ncbi:hypothetical protein V7201_19535 [Bacillus sp. JJ1122]|uniref:hypothetical protein n=1 Tax=Bacillus sp. JJ1122 TaxID=3122951 RepID=UPI002FFDE1BA